MSTLVKTLDIGNKKSVFRQFIIPVLVSLCLSMSAWMTIPLPFSMVPITIQPQLIFFLPILLGRRGALIAISLFLAQAAINMPVLAGCTGGLYKFIGPTAGYIFFYLISPLVISPIYEKLKMKSGRNRAFIAMFMGSMVNFVFGVAWLSTFIGLKAAFLTGFVPFIIGDAVKLLFFSSLVSSQPKESQLQ
ncbi:MAG: biotin transporter BioY [Rhabdochlamydiaceae bacterium]|nr:biotin transporter BioY [Candidatus Amphrikana amoebophyrae]